MPFRFQRRVKLFPGVSLNLSKSGVSTSARLGNLTLNSRGIVTASAPGTGISYRHHVGSSAPSVVRTAPGVTIAKPSAPGTRRIAAGITCCVIGAVCPVVSLLAIPLLASGYEARCNHTNA